MAAEQRDLKYLLMWLEYGRESGYVAKEQEEALAAQLRNLLNLASLARDVIDDELENRPARHSLDMIHAGLTAVLNGWRY